MPIDTLARADIAGLRRDVDRIDDAHEELAEDVETLKIGHAVLGRTVAIYAALGGGLAGLAGSIGAGLVVFLVTRHHL